ncbi:putative NADH dehydrogenase [ubiquinone] 1 alpha subcomplex assembly factor 3-like [Capsicum annuum]|nr:putative NADH dehydrogenase [ubiquinone] 1 alpha subcomplex assembly factor 3-like [Capsicum annuum]
MATQKSLLHPLQCLPLQLKNQNPQKKCHLFKQKQRKLVTSKLRAAVIGGGPAGSSAAEALTTGGVETFLFERRPATAKPCGGAIPLCMLREFSIPSHLIDHHVNQMTIFSPSNVIADIGKTLKPHKLVAILQREVLDSFLRQRAESSGATLLKALVTNPVVPHTHMSHTSFTTPLIMPASALRGCLHWCRWSQQSCG